MATLSTTIPDAMVTRVRAAFGDYDTNHVWIPASAAQLSKAIQRFIAGRLVEYEGGRAQIDTTTSVQAEISQWP